MASCEIATFELWYYTLLRRAQNGLDIPDSDGSVFFEGELKTNYRLDHCPVAGGIVQSNLSNVCIYTRRPMRGSLKK